MYGFSWIIDGKLAGMARPGASGDLEADIRELAAQGVKLLVTMTEGAIDPDLLARYDIHALHLPVVDFQPPSVEQLTRFVAESKLTIEQGGAVCVHCAAGIGRTGTALAAFLIAEGYTPEAAIGEIRHQRPGSIETQGQVESLHAFAKAVKGE